MLDRAARIGLFVVLLVGITRHLLLGCFVHPFADDFSYAVAGMRTELIPRLFQEYSSWNGRYFSNILVLRGPLVLGLKQGLVLYRCIAMASILFTCYAAHRFVLRSFTNSLTAGTRWAMALLFVLLVLHTMPDVNEGFYWYTGAMTYQLPNALSLLVFGNWIAFFQRDRPTSVGWVIGQCALIVIIAGCNELHMAIMVLVHAALLVHDRIRSKKLDPVLAGLLAVAVVCAVVVFLAPGNGTRSALFPHRHELLRTFAYGVAQSARFTSKWLFLSPILLFSLALAIYRRSRPSDRAFFLLLQRVNKWWALALPFMIVLVAMVVTYWPTGTLGQYRTVNVACFYFIPAWCFAMLVWDVQVFEPKGWVFSHPDRHLINGLFVVLCGCTFLFFGRDGLVTDDLLSRRVGRYDRGTHEWYHLITGSVQSGAETLELPFVVIPKSLHILPLDSSPDHWMNRSLADYFGNAALDITVRPPAE
ncbi:MAG: hypothetical protein IPL64_17135 [Flavobacteriales bacterium]|nr:hypothetical protein [Flavobacteriales bacterium]HQW06218.1 DUF6056 family protein [Flavobacteriales bacterium]